MRWLVTYTGGWEPDTLPEDAHVQVNGGVLHIRRYSPDEDLISERYLSPSAWLEVRRDA